MNWSEPDICAWICFSTVLASSVVVVVSKVVDVVGGSVVVATVTGAVAGPVTVVAGRDLVVGADGGMVETPEPPSDPVARTPMEAPCPQAVRAIATIAITRADR